MKPGTLFSIDIGGGRKRFVQFLTRDLTGERADVVCVFQKSYVEWDTPQPDMVTQDAVLFNARVRVRDLKRAGILKKEGIVAEPAPTAGLRFTDGYSEWTPNGPTVPLMTEAGTLEDGRPMTPEAFQARARADAESFRSVPVATEPLEAFYPNPYVSLIVGLVLMAIGPLIWHFGQMDGENMRWVLPVFELAGILFILTSLYTFRSERPRIRLFKDRVEVFDQRKSITRVFPFADIISIQKARVRVPAGKHSKYIHVARLHFRGEEAQSDSKGLLRMRELFDPKSMISLSDLRVKGDVVLEALDKAWSQYRTQFR